MSRRSPVSGVTSTVGHRDGSTRASGMSPRRMRTPFRQLGDAGGAAPLLVLQVLTDEEPLMKRGNHRSADKERVCGRELSLQVVKGAAWIGSLDNTRHQRIKTGCAGRPQVG